LWYENPYFSRRYPVFHNRSYLLYASSDAKFPILWFPGRIEGAAGGFAGSGKYIRIDCCIRPSGSTQCRDGSRIRERGPLWTAQRTEHYIKDRTEKPLLIRHYLYQCNNYFAFFSLLGLRGREAPGVMPFVRPACPPFCRNAQRCAHAEEAKALAPLRFSRSSWFAYSLLPPSVRLSRVSESLPSLQGS
jgi:hypothetical protein